MLLWLTHSKLFEKVYWDYSHFYHYVFSQAIPKVQLMSHRGLTLFCRGGRVWYGPQTMSVIKTQLKLAKAKRKTTGSGSSEICWALFAFLGFKQACPWGNDRVMVLPIGLHYPKLLWAQERLYVSVYIKVQNRIQIAQLYLMGLSVD